jgi:hypothetical protein
MYNTEKVNNFMIKDILMILHLGQKKEWKYYLNVLLTIRLGECWNFVRTQIGEEVTNGWLVGLRRVDRVGDKNVDSRQMYKVQQFNTQNGPVKAKYAYLCISGCCHLGNFALVKLCISWDEGPTARNSP